MNDNEKDTVKEIIKELMNLTNDCTYLDKTGAVELEKRLTDITQKLIDIL